MHLKRQEVPRSWPIYRKGTKYVVRPGANIESSVPLLIVLRDMLKIAQNRKEVKRAIFLKQISVNGKTPRDEKTPIMLFDTVALVPTGENYRLSLSDKGKFMLEKINAQDSHKKIAKIVNKRVLKGKKVQLNLQDGGNVLSDIGCKVNDSVVINFQSKKAEKCIPLKENSNVFVLSGKYAGGSGKIISIDGKKKVVEIESRGERLGVLIKQIIVTG